MNTTMNGPQFGSLYNTKGGGISVLNNRIQNVIEEDQNEHNLTFPSLERDGAQSSNKSSQSSSSL